MFVEQRPLQAIADLTLSQIGEGLRRFGVNAKSQSVLAVRIGPALRSSALETVKQALHVIVKGTVEPLSNLQGSFDQAAVQKVRFGP